MEIEIEELIPETIAGYAGILAPLVGYFLIIISIAMQADFTLAQNSLSDLGALGVQYKNVFNFALIISGILFLIFILGMLRMTETRVGDIGILGLALGAIFLSLTGIFPKGTFPHPAMAILFYFASIGGLTLYGLDRFLEFEPVWAVFTWSSMGFAAISIGLVSILSPEGIAIYEIIGTIPLIQFSMVFGTHLITE
ncbi:MAG: DUF998 domain-containing protein [Candidatus Natronoplasma sp.]